MIRFNKTYFIIASIIFIVEVLIAIFVRDRFVRPYLGDVLVVILIYCFVKSFLSWPYQLTAMGVLFFSFFIEWLQSINFVEKIGLKHSTLANTIVGNSFAWLDVLAYIVGIAIVLVIEKRKVRKIFI
jgi:hypothetical protein